jgi:hypothetical protein
MKDVGFSFSVGRCAKSITTQTRSTGRRETASKMKYELTFTMQSKFDFFHSFSIKRKIAFVWISLFLVFVITIDFMS